MSTIKSLHLWILYILLLAAVLPIHGQEASVSNIVSRTFLSADETKSIVQRVYDKLQFEGGYCQAAKYSATQDNFTFFYYDQDHLGSIRQVRIVMSQGKGPILQTMNYYPFGAQFCDGSASSSDVQSHKYNGKELDKMHGLNTYDHGARQYNPVTARWDRMDPLAEKYYPTSPYVFCGNNPINRIDKDGRIWDAIIDLAFVAYDVAEVTYQYCTTGHVSNTTKTALGADALAAAVPGLTGTGLAVRTGKKSVELAKGTEKTLQSASKNSKIEKLHKSAEIGQEAHRQIEKELKTRIPGTKTEVIINLTKEKSVRKDAVLPDGTTIIIKPDTKFGHKAAEQRKKLMKDHGFDSQIIIIHRILRIYQHPQLILALK